MYDVIVVGSGPAGASAAYELARSGTRVLILERAKLPRYKTCGGAIPHNFFQTLPPRVQKTQLTLSLRCAVFGPQKKQVHHVKSPKLAGVMRDQFDHEFAMAAVDEGAELIDENPVTQVEEERDRVRLKTRRGTFEGRYLVGADGATGVVKRGLGIGSREPAVPALEVEIAPRGKATEGDVTLLRFGLIRDGYAWIFPKKNIDSMGILSFNRDRQKVRQKLVEWAALCGYRLEGQRVHGHPIPIWTRRSKLSTERSLLVGDAANTVDPLGGEGIRYGILSGRIAAQHLRQAIQEGRSIASSYSGVIYEKIQSDFVYAKWLARIFYHFPSFCFDLWLRAANTFNLAEQVLYGELTYRELFTRAIRCLTRVKNYRRLFHSSGGLQDA